ncbi:hypothetical protein Rcae01_04520 [Novipirellula caenicola]|uniref:Uncharacterized protein n=1 Tax=Novipirellula caenicola TaxID=1536901 RepID=A0ABP9VW43_9BACT
MYKLASPVRSLGPIDYEAKNRMDSFTAVGMQSRWQANATTTAKANGRGHRCGRNLLSLYTTATDSRII